MEGSLDAYEQLLGKLSELLPDIAQQIRAEVSPGRQLLAAPSPRSRARRDEPPLLDTSATPYDADTKLTILLTALLTLARSMALTRQFLAETLPGEVITFQSPDDEAFTLTLGDSVAEDVRKLHDSVAAFSNALAIVRDPRTATS